MGQWPTQGGDSLSDSFEVGQGLHQTVPMHGLSSHHFGAATYNDLVDNPGSVLETFGSFSSASQDTSVSQGLGAVSSSFSSTGSSGAADSFHPFETGSCSQFEGQSSNTRNLYPQDLRSRIPSPCMSEMGRETALEVGGDSPIADAPDIASKLPVKAKKGKSKPGRTSKSKQFSNRAIQPKTAESKGAAGIRKELPDRATKSLKPRSGSPKPSSGTLTRPKSCHIMSNVPDPVQGTVPVSMPIQGDQVHAPVKPVSSTDWSMERLGQGRISAPLKAFWQVQLLRQGVAKFAKEAENGRMKVPWKQVAEYIQRKGGSYLFGNATCRKKWDELVQNGDENGDYGEEEE
ncbi:predicted protein [Verticillium alfalfae VaMs.102]|uniref:Predicted protein n=1 Tax=Verticillium alfalfae (strain VaMs.102 / ATCC MYA-4576 / FGSC 10136) TaxID=526221 RepID=C9SDM2_VERA1|nr:predicted protein [Verticillium alfalfae VaMs.102]EEY16443.1 predicted protein [Verticillium alfalfae VaMs.102]